MISAATLSGGEREVVVIGVGDKYRQTMARLDQLTAWNFRDLDRPPN